MRKKLIFIFLINIALLANCTNEANGCFEKKWQIEGKIHSTRACYLDRNQEKILLTTVWNKGPVYYRIINDNENNPWKSMFPASQYMQDAKNELDWDYYAIEILSSGTFGVDFKMLNDVGKEIELKGWNFTIKW